MKINLNHPITVTLTEKGRHFFILKNHISDIPLGLEFNDCSKVTAEGWRIMKVFSPLLTGIASDTPFDMNIEIHAALTPAQIKLLTSLLAREENRLVNLVKARTDDGKPSLSFEHLKRALDIRNINEIIISPGDGAQTPNEQPYD